MLLLFSGLGAGVSSALSMMVEMDFGAGYVDVTTDVLADGLYLEYGIFGNSPLDRMASSGTLEFALRNDASNSAGLLGYYSPNHVNCRSGFTFGIPVRVQFVFETVTRTKFVGKLYVIDPVPGQKRTRRTYCTVHDYMYELAETDLREIPTQVGKTETELLDEVLSALPITVQPLATDFDTGLDVYPYALDDLEKGLKAATVLNHIMSSAWGKLFTKGDGTLTYRNRQSDQLQTVDGELDEDMTELSVPSSQETVKDFIRVTTHPRTVTATDTVVLFSAPTTDTPEFADTETKVFWEEYRNPVNEDLKAGGIDFQFASGGPISGTLVPTTDYTANTLANGTGVDKTAQFTANVSFFGSQAKVEFTNNSGGVAFLTKRQGRGRGLYDVAPFTQESGTGTRQLDVDLIYQDDANIAKDLADLILNEREIINKQVDEVTFNPHKSDELIRQALDREPGDLVLLSETVTGLIGTPAIIHRVALRVVGPLRLECTWGLAPTVAGGQWLLGIVGQSETSETTEWGYA